MEKEISPVNKDCLKLQGHDFTLFMLDSVLNIYVETSYPGSRVFKTEINNSDAESLTKIYNQAQTLYELLLDGMPGLLPNVKVWFTDDAKLNYQSEFEIGKKKNIFYFSIAFKEVELEPIKELELKARKLAMTAETQEIKIKVLDDELKQGQKIIKEMEEKISSLIDENNNLNRRIREIEKFIEDKVLLKILNEGNVKFYFDNQSVNKDHFIFSNDNKSIKMKSSNNWKMIFMKKPISKIAENELVIRIDQHNGAGGLMFGVAFTNLRSHTGDHHVDRKYCFLMNDEGFSHPDCQKRSANFNLKSESIVKIKANLFEKSVSFEHNKTHVYKHYLEQSSIEEYGCYFVVLLYYCDDMLTILHE